MKTILTTVLPAMALLALGGCATTSALSSTESDGVYYSSKDRTTYNAPARSTASAPVRDEAPESPASDAEVNPDYAASGSSSSSSSQSGSTEYYDDDYGYSARIRRFHQPAYRSFSYGYYDPFYADPFWYGGSPFAYYGGGYGGFYGGYDPFYSPFYGSSAVIINIGFGRPYYNPWRYGGYGYGGGYGYNRGYYDGYRNGLYNGYGYGGYGNGYYGNNGYYGGGTIGRSVPYKSRGNTGREVLTTGRATTAGSGTGRGRGEREGGVAAPVGGGTINGGAATANPAYNGRSRVQPAGTASENGVATPGRVGRTREGSGQVLRRNAVFENESGGVVNSRGREAVEQPRTTESNGRRWRVVENGGSATPQPTDAPTYSEQRRSRTREVYSGNGEQRGGEQAVEQPIRRQRSSEQAAEQPVRRQRSESAPQRTYEAPQRSYESPSRSYEAPSRSSSPSMNSGGGNSGGGGRSGGGRGRD